MDSVVTGSHRICHQLSSFLHAIVVSIDFYSEGEVLILWEKSKMSSNLLLKHFLVIAFCLPRLYPLVFSDVRIPNSKNILFLKIKENRGSFNSWFRRLKIEWLHVVRDFIVGRRVSESAWNREKPNEHS